MLPPPNIIWFKRDLRLQDHAPLAAAAMAGRVLPLYIIEPALWKRSGAIMPIHTIFSDYCEKCTYDPDEMTGENACRFNAWKMLVAAVMGAYMPKGVKKANLPRKICIRCGRPFTWRKKWHTVWNDVKYCSDKCKKQP
jgi:hypothetical protein